MIDDGGTAAAAGTSGDAASPVLAAHAWPRGWRAVAGLLVLISRASLPALALFVAFFQDEAPTLPVLLQAVAALSVLPALAAALVARAHAVPIHAGDSTLRIGDAGTAIPCAQIASTRAWRVPLPEPGVSLVQRGAGPPARLDLGARDAAALAALLERAGLPALPSGAALVWARARAAEPRSLWRRPAVKFGLFALVPTAILFNAHQYIAYGGPLGQYHLEGLGPYLRTFAEYWATAALYLVLYASVWRAVAEIACFAVAGAAPSRGATVRRVAERACLVLVYAGIPALVALRFLV